MMKRFLSLFKCLFLLEPVHLATENRHMFKLIKPETNNQTALLIMITFPIFGLQSLSHGRQAGEEVLALAEDQQD